MTETFAVTTADAADTFSSSPTELFSIKPRSASVDLLVETSEVPDKNTHPTEKIQRRANEYVETDDGFYVAVEGCGETSTDFLPEPLEHNLTLQTKASSQRPTESHSRLLDQLDSHVNLQTEIHQMEFPENNKRSKTASDTFYSSLITNAISSPPPALHQHEPKSLQDSALSHLIDAVSLGNEHDTCSSISALIDRFEVTAEQSNLNSSSASRPPQLSVPHINNQLFSTPQKMILDFPQKAQPTVKKHFPCSPETTESTVFTILDEQELSPAFTYGISDQTRCKNLENLEGTSPDGSRGSALTKIPFGGAVKENSGWESHRNKSYKLQSQALGFSKNWEYGCYKDTSINSTASERFLICHDSASSSLMEVEVNVDGEPFNTSLSLVPSHQRSLQTSLYSPPSMSKHAFNLTESSPFHSSSSHQPYVSSTHQLDYQIKKPQTEQSNKSNVTMSGHFKPCKYNGITYNNRYFETRDKHGMICKMQPFQNGFSSSECLLPTQDINSQPQNGSYRFGSDCDMISSSVEYKDTFVSSKQYSNQALKPTHSEIYKGIYLVGSSVPTSPSPCKSKSLGDLTSEDISCNFQSKYKVISRSFITPAMRDQKRMCVRANQPHASDPLTEQLRKLVTLDEVDPNPSQFQLTPKSLSVFPPGPLNSVVSKEDLHDPPPFLSRKLSSRSQSRVRHIANRARERQQEALKLQPAGGNPDVVLRNKAVSSQNSLINRHSTGSYIAGYLEQVGLQDRGLPEGSSKTLCYGNHDHCYTDDSVIPDSSCPLSEPEVYFLLRI